MNNGNVRSLSSKLEGTPSIVGLDGREVGSGGGCKREGTGQSPADKGEGLAGWKLRADSFIAGAGTSE